MGHQITVVALFVQVYRITGSSAAVAVSRAVQLLPMLPGLRSADRPPGPAPAADRRSSASRARRCCCSQARSRGTRRLALLYFAAAQCRADKFGHAKRCRNDPESHPAS